MGTQTKHKMRHGITLGIMAGLTALTLGCSPFLLKKVDHHPVKEGVVENFPVKISYDNNGCWRYIKIRSPDGKYIGAEDYVTDCDNRFNSRTTNLSQEGDEDVGHPLAKFNNFETLENVYQDLMSQNSPKQKNR